MINNDSRLQPANIYQHEKKMMSLPKVPRQYMILLWAWETTQNEFLDRLDYVASHKL